MLMEVLVCMAELSVSINSRLMSFFTKALTSVCTYALEISAVHNLLESGNLPADKEIKTNGRPGQLERLLISSV